MVDIQSATAENRRGKKKEEESSNRSSKTYVLSAINTKWFTYKTVDKCNLTDNSSFHRLNGREINKIQVDTQR